MSEVLKDFSANIDLKETLVFEPIKVVEGDNGNVLVLNIVKDGDPVDLTDCLVQIIFAHSGRTVWQDSSSPSGGITISGDDHNIVTVRLHSDSYAPNGITVCQVKVYSGAGQTTLVSSSRFSFKAELSLLNSETVESIEQYSILVTLIETVNGMLDRDQADWDETDTLKVSFIKNKPVAGTDFQAPTQTLTAETTLSDTDTVPFYDASATAHRKSTWANIVATITALFRSIFMPYDATSTNLIINGNFPANQRAKSGTVTLSAGAYGHDRWKAGASGCTYTFATSENVTTLTISAGSLIQVVEGLNLKSGTVCLSWTGTAQGKIGSGSFGASGITGTAVGGTNLNIEFNTGTVSNVQLNYGSVALPFVPMSYANELRLCQRYAYPLVAGDSFTVRMTSYNANVILFYLPLPVVLRSSPTIIGTAGTDYYVSATNGTAQSGFTLAAYAVAGGLLLVASKNSHGLTDGSLSIVGPAGGFDSEL